MRKRHSQLLGLVIILLLVPFALLPAPAQAEPEADAWTRYPIPQKGEAGGWVLTGGGTGVTAIGVSYDGTLYAATEETSGSLLNGYNLFKSTDDGYTWTPLWKIPANDKPAGGPVSDPASKIIALLLPRWEYPDILYLATQYNVYKSTDGGENFTTVGIRPAYSSGTNPTSCLITSLDVTYFHNNYLVLVGSRDADAGAGDYGGIYFYDESQFFTSWLDLRVGGGAAGTKYDVLDVAFSPNFTDDMQVVAVVTDETDTIITTKLNYSDWGAVIGDATLSDVVATGGCLAFPADYDSSDVEDKYIQYIGLDAGVASAVYMVIGYETPDSSLVLPMFFPDPTKAVHSIVAAGEAYNATIVAGLTNGNVLSNGRASYTPPSVTSTASNACVALGGFYSSGYVVYAGTSGTNGGFARSIDSGDSFAQTAFICDDLQTITDLAVSPNYAIDSTMYMITEGNSGRSILWRTTDSGETWDAVLTKGQEITLSFGSTVTVPKFDKVAISPRFASDTTVFIRERGNAPDIWRSTDNGFHFSPLPSKSGTTGTINSWAIVNNREILVGDSLGDFYKTANGRLTWSPAVATGLSSFNSMALSPDYDRDSTILAGGDGGKVYLSTDDGETWDLVGEALINDAGGYPTWVIFDPGYATNHTIYAATGDVIARCIIDPEADWADQEWELLCDELEYATGIAVAGDTALYVADLDEVEDTSKPVDGVRDTGGVLRSLNPDAEDADDVVFERIAEGLLIPNADGGTELRHLWLTCDVSDDGCAENVLWSLEQYGAHKENIWVYEDTLAAPITLDMPVNEQKLTTTDKATLSWEEFCGADCYQVSLWSYCRECPDQKLVVDLCLECEPGGTVACGPGIDCVENCCVCTGEPCIVVDGLEPGTTYYWQVRVCQGKPLLSKWSEERTFTTAMEVPIRCSPICGAEDISLTPNFSWSEVPGATGYEFVLSRDSQFSNVVVALTGANALSTTVWACTQDLEYNTSYFWRVRAISATSQSRWGVGVFTTEAAPKAPPQLPQPPPQASSSQSGAPLYLWVALGIGVALIVVVLGLIVVTLRARP